MPKAQGLTLDLGPITLALLRGLPPAYAGWLVQTLAVYVETGAVPEKIAPRHLGAWIAAKEEFDARARSAAARTEAARPAAKARAKQAEEAAAELPGADWNGTAAQEAPAANPPPSPASAPEGARTATETAATASPAGRPCGNGREALARFWDKLEAEADGPYSVLLQVHDAMLPEFAAWVCREPENTRAVSAYRSGMRQIGAVAFRRCLEEFLGECATPGGEPERRGAAFMARLKYEISSVREVRA